RSVVIAGGGHHQPTASPHGQAIFLHQPHHRLVVDAVTLLMQFKGHPAVAIGRPFGTDRLDLLDKPSLVDRLRRRHVVIGRARKSHQSASFCDRETSGPATTDVVAFFGRRSCCNTPFKKSFSSASLPASRSRAAIRAS